MRTVGPVTALTLAALFAAPALGQVVVGPIMDPPSGNRYYRLAALSYNAARAQAVALGGDLVTISSAAQNTWLNTNIAAAGGNTQECFIGFNDLVAEGSFVWTSGEPNFYTNWNVGEPNNSGNEDAGAINPTTGLWNDLPATAAFARPSIVQITGPIMVPQEYPSIQAAIDASMDGQTILVAPGTYIANLNFNAKKIVVRSSGGPLVTTLRTLDLTFGVQIAGGQGPETVFEGFTVTPYASTSQLITVGGSPTVRNCRITSASNYAFVSFGPCTLSDTLIVGGAGAIGLAGVGTMQVQNCTIVGCNIAVVCQNNAAGPAVLNVANSIIRGNNTLVAPSSQTALRFSCSDVQGGAPGVGNINADPLFVSAPGPNGIYELSDDFNLRPGSPCIDAGNNAARAWVGSVAALDILGHARFFDDLSRAGTGPGPVVDMGAVEFNGNSCPADFDADGTVDFFDYDAFVQAFELGCM